MNNLSIIIPVKSNDDAWKGLLDELLIQPGSFEIIMVGPDFQNMISENPKVQYVFSKQGRAHQQNVGAQASTKSFLWFLHADSRLSNRSLQKIEEKLKGKPDSIFFFV